MNDLNIVLGKQVLITALKRIKYSEIHLRNAKPCTLKLKKKTTERN